MTESTKYRLVSIDAWRNECGGWDWNNSYKVADDIELPDEITARKLLRFVYPRSLASIYASICSFKYLRN